MGGGFWGDRRVAINPHQHPPSPMEKSAHDAVCSWVLGEAATSAYHHATAMSFTESHHWVPYDIFIFVLQDLMLHLFEVAGKRSSMRYRFMHLTWHLSPFSSDCYFPVDDFYLCIGITPLSLQLVRVSHALALAGASELATESAYGEYYKGI